MTGRAAMAVAVLLLVPLGASHVPTQANDTHKYVAGGEFGLACDVDEALAAAPVHGIGGACFDIGTDLRDGVGFRFNLADRHAWPVGGTVSMTDLGGSPLGAAEPFCGQYPWNGTFAPLPADVHRVEIRVYGPTGPVVCRALGLIGLPGTAGIVTLEIF